MREFKANPFVLSEDEKRAKEDEVARQREDFIAEYGTHGSDGIIFDWIADAGLRMMDNTEEVIDGFREGVRDLGSLVLCAPGIIRDKLSDK